MRELRLALACLATAVAPVVILLLATDACGDVCLLGAMAYVFGVPVGAVAGVVAGILTPRQDGWLGFGLAVFGVAVGFAIAAWGLLAPSWTVEILTLFGPPLIGSVAIAFAVVRLIARRAGGRSGPTAEA